MLGGVTEFLRPEDGHWDPSNPDDFYFVTTDRFDTVQTPTSGGVANTPASRVGNSRLWRLRFDDVRDPALGGTLSVLLNGTEGPQMMDNITIDAPRQHPDPGGRGRAAVPQPDLVVLDRGRHRDGDRGARSGPVLARRAGAS